METRSPASDEVVFQSSGWILPWRVEDLAKSSLDDCLEGEGDETFWSFCIRLPTSKNDIFFDDKGGFGAVGDSLAQSGPNSRSVEFVEIED